MAATSAAGSLIDVPEIFSKVPPKGFVQGTKLMQTQQSIDLKSHPDWVAAQQDGLRLLAIIKKVTYTFEERRYLPDALLDVKEEFYEMKQGRNETLQRYYERFKNQVAVMSEVGVSIADIAAIQECAINNGRIGYPNDDDRKEAVERTLAIRFIRGANKRFKTYLTELRHAALDGNRHYPATLSDAYNIMQRRREASAPMIDDGGGDGLAFVTATVGRNGRTYNHITCRNCNRVGHYADQCPDGGDGEQGIVFTSSVNPSAVIPKDWLLIDSQAKSDSLTTLSSICLCPEQIPFSDIERLGGLNDVWLILKKEGPPADSGKIKVLPRIQNQSGFANLVQATMGECNRNLADSKTSAGVELVVTAEAVGIEEGDQSPNEMATVKV